MTDAIIVEHLHKTFKTKVKDGGFGASVRSLFNPEYKTTRAVDNISFRIPRGQLVGFIGPNGAGKSTTIKMLTGILYPDQHANLTVSVLGMTPWVERKKLAYRIGTVFGQRSQLWMHLPPQDSFDLFAAIYGIPEDTYRKRLKHLVETFEIHDLLTTPVRKLSLGQRMRCELVAALLHDPEVLYLDEPSIGLDILAKKALRDHIKRINAQGVTVLLTSHDLDDIEEVCDRVIIINSGRIVHDSSFEELRKSYLQKKLITVYKRKAAKRLELQGVHVAHDDKDVTKLVVDTKTTDIHTVLSAVAAHYAIDDIEIADPPIEEVIEEIYRRSG